MIKYIIAGCFIVTIGATVFNCAADLIATLSEWLKSIISIRILTNNAKINELAAQEEPINIHPIGFHIDSEEEEEEEDDEDE